MKAEQAKVGARVMSRVEFSGVPIGTEGVIDQDYGTGVMVAWDRPTEHAAALPAGYRAYHGRPGVVTGLLRDGFDKATELQLLELLRPGPGQ